MVDISIISLTLLCVCTTGNIIIVWHTYGDKNKRNNNAIKFPMNNPPKTVGNDLSLIASMKITFLNDIPDRPPT